MIERLKRQLAFQVALGLVSLGYIIIALPYLNRLFALHLGLFLNGPERYAAAFMLIVPGAAGLQLISRAHADQMQADRHDDTR